MNKKLISIIAPAYNEELNIEKFYNEFLNFFAKIGDKYDYEIIFVNDGSLDNTWSKIFQLSLQDKKVKAISFSRNFGKEIALTAGVEYSQGDVILTTDVDLQRPMEIINYFIKNWEEGIDISYGIRTEMNRGFFRKFCSSIFNYLMTKISDIKFESGLTDFMLIDRKVIDYFLKYEDKNRIFRGIILSLGFAKKGVYFVEPERVNGSTKWSFSKLTKLAVDSITSFTIFPLKFIGYFGIFIMFLSSVVLISMFVSRFFLGNPYAITNSAFLIVSNVFLSGITLTGLGIVAIYIAKIHGEVVGKPLYIVKDKINFKE
ncbi:hypothetical protein BLD25_02540 [Candidatus Gracilibacteria bacterium GN02-872]|nr:hypothetical protein BLD25_02540 [Candidatus Gracilibacteria bacterium GN02-872]